MSEKNRATRPSLATFLHGKQGASAPDADTGDDPAATAAHTPEIVQQPALLQHDIASVSAEPSLAASDDAEAIAQDSDAEERDSSAATAPNFLRGPRAAARPARPTPRWQWALVAALAVLLALQIIVADRARLAADAGTRPLVSALCRVLRCTLPAWHEPSAYTMLSREVRPVPEQPGALQVQASFRNEARWAQAWPALRLSLSDADGRVIGRRTLQPADYLGAAADPSARLEPGQSAQVSFRLREPAAATVAFSFEFQ